MLAKVARAFGPIARPAAALEAEYTVEPVQDGERSVQLRRVGGSASVSVLYHAMPATTRDFAAVRVLAQLLSLDNGPLGLALVRRGIGVSQWATAWSTRDPGHLLAGLSLPEGADEAAVAQAGQALARTMESLSITEAQVQQARGLALKTINDALRDPERLSLGLSESVALGDWRLWFAMRDWIESVTLADVQRIASTWLLASNRTAGSYLPTATVPAARAAAGAGRRGRGAGGLQGQGGRRRGRRLRAHTGQHRGAPRLSAPHGAGHARPARRAAAAPDQGRARDRHAAPALGQRREHERPGGAGQHGRADADAGAAGRSEEQIAQALLALDARLRIVSGPENLTATFELPAGKLAEFHALLFGLLRAPAFDDAAFERLQKNQIADSAEPRGPTPPRWPANALQRVFAAAAADEAGRAAGRYPSGDPRTARTFDETEALMRAASAARLRDFWRASPAPGTASWCWSARSSRTR